MSVRSVEPQLEILFRYLTLHYGSPDGLKALIPRKDHRAVLRDVATDALLPLSEAWVRLEVDGKAAERGRTTVQPNNLLVRLEDALKVADVAPEPQYLATGPVNPRLNALVELSRGSLAAYPSEAYPERATERVTFDFGPTYMFEAVITDTTFYRASLPPGPRYELVVSTPRRTVRLDVSGGGRFEIRNEDEKFGATPDERAYHRAEFEEVLTLVGMAARIQCDIFSCGIFYCGDTASA